MLVVVAILAGAGLLRLVPDAHAARASVADVQTPMAAATIALLEIPAHRDSSRYLGPRRPGLKRNLRESSLPYQRSVRGFVWHYRASRLTSEDAAMTPTAKGEEEHTEVQSQVGMAVDQGSPQSVHLVAQRIDCAEHTSHAGMMATGQSVLNAKTGAS